MANAVITMLNRPFAGWSQAKRQGWATVLLAVVFAVYPLLTDDDSNIDTIANAMSYATLALGLNIVVGFAGLLDLGYAAFFAIGAYYYGIFTAYQVMPHWSSGWEPLAFLGLVEKVNQGSGDLVHFTLSFWLALPTGALVAGFFGLMFGAPTLRLRGDYLAIVTLGFGEIVPIVARNADSITNGAAGLNGVAGPKIGSYHFGVDATPYYYVGMGLVAILIFSSIRLRDCAEGTSRKRSTSRRIFSVSKRIASGCSTCTGSLGSGSHAVSAKKRIPPQRTTRPTPRVSGSGCGLFFSASQEQLRGP